MPIWYFSLNNMIKSIGLSWGKKGLVTLKIEILINLEVKMPVDRFEYKYECPTKRGFKKFKISNRDQNRIFKYRKAKWSCKYEFYLLDKTIIMFKLPSKLFCIVATLLLPLSILLLGVMNYKRIYKESVLDTWNAKERGAFSQDAIYKRENDDGTFDELMSCAKWE